MNISNGLKVMILAALITVAGSGQIEARGRHHHGVRPQRVVVHVPASRPVVTSRVSNRCARQERLAMAIAYLRNHKHLTVKQYAKITSLDRNAAEAELDVFAMNRNIPIRAIIKGKKKLYTRNDA